MFVRWMIGVGIYWLACLNFFIHICKRIVSFAAGFIKFIRFFLLGLTIQILYVAAVCSLLYYSYCYFFSTQIFSDVSGIAFMQLLADDSIDLRLICERPLFIKNLKLLSVTEWTTFVLLKLKYLDSLLIFEVQASVSVVLWQLYYAGFTALYAFPDYTFYSIKIDYF